MDINSVMIVDDSEGDQFLTKLEIEEFDSNISISQAYDGQEAIEMLDKMDSQPDIIFLDINMPRMNGLEFLEEYNKRDEHATVIAMLTSSDQKNDKETALSYGFVRQYVLKLLDADVLADLKAMND